MKKILSVSLLLSTILMAAPGDTVTEGSDAKLKNVTLDERIYQQDGFGANWAFDAGSDGLWAVPEKKVIAGTSYNAPFKIRNGATANTLVIGNNDDTNMTNGFVGIGTDTPAAQLNVKGDVLADWSGPNSERDGLTNLLVLSANNTDASKVSDVGFQMVNAKTNKNWKFRTGLDGDAFVATKDLTGGAEFKIINDTTSSTNAIMEVGGVTVFENGHLVTASSRELKTDIKPLDTQAALDAFHKLQPVSYEYKAQKGEPVVGFIAEDIPDLVAMPSRHALDSTEIVAVLTKVMQEQDKVLSDTRKELKEAQEKIARLEKMEKKVAMMESILTNLALDTSKTDKEKVSLNK